MNSTLDDYIAEMEKDLELDELNMKEVQMKIPALKHKWVGRLMRHKAQTASLYKKKDDMKKEATKKARDSSMYNMSDAGLEKLIEKQEPIVKINREIADNSIVIEFLERSERIFTSLTYDIKNLIEIMKLETL